MPKKNVFRFAVGSPSNLQSWIWRFWVHKNDVYLGAKDALKVFKVSLHSSDVWRIAFVSELEREDSSTDRVIQRWKRPGEFLMGWTSSVAVLISDIQPGQSFNHINIDDIRIKWIDLPVNGEKLLFILFFSRNGYEKSLKKILLKTDEVICQFSKKNGEKVWLILRHEDLSPFESEKIKDVMNNTKIQLKPNTSIDSVYGARALSVISENSPGIYNQPTIIDIPLGIENIDW